MGDRINLRKIFFIFLFLGLAFLAKSFSSSYALAIDSVVVGDLVSNGGVSVNVFIEFYNGSGVKYDDTTCFVPAGSTVSCNSEINTSGGYTTAHSINYDVIGCFDPPVTTTLAGRVDGTTWVWDYGDLDVTCPAAPTGLTASCDAANTLRFSWTDTTHTKYAIRVNDTSTPANPDHSNDNVSSNSYSIPGTAGRTYDWWVHTIYRDLWSNQTTQLGNPSCPAAPTVTLSGRVTRSDTSAGIGGVTINQNDNPCGSLGTATTDGNGYFYYSNVDVGITFCLRGPPLGGYSGPTAPNAGGGLGSYECQTAGQYRNPDACGFSYDWSADNAYNFVYTPSATTGNFVGYVFNDLNSNGSRDAGEPYIQKAVFAVPNCSQSYVVAEPGLEVSWGSIWTWPINCNGNGEPYYDSGQITAGNYTVSLAVPTGWIATTATSYGVTVPSGGGAKVSCFWIV